MAFIAKFGMQVAEMIRAAEMICAAVGTAAL